MKNKNQILIDFLQTHVGELSEKDKETALHLDNMLDESRPRYMSRSHTRKNRFLQHLAISLMTAVICLSIVLPITLTGRNGALPTPEQRIFTVGDVTYLDIQLGNFTSLQGLLMFEPINHLPLWVDNATEVGKIEFVEQPATMLGYSLNETILLLDGKGFIMSFRIRTFKYYHFAGYVEQHFSALEIASGNPVTNQTSQTIWEEREGNPWPTIVNTFVIGDHDMNVFYSINTNVAETITFVSIFFTYGGNDYFIRLEDAGNVITSNFLETVFMATLLESPRTGGEGV